MISIIFLYFVIKIRLFWQINYIKYDYKFYLKQVLILNIKFYCISTLYYIHINSIYMCNWIIENIKFILDIELLNFKEKEKVW